MVKSDFLSQERAVKLFNHSYLNFSGKYFIRLQYNQPYAELIAKLEMGCFGSSLNKQKRTVVAKKVRKPKPWKFPRPVTWNQLVQMRYEFWDTAPHHGGKKEIWDAIHAAAEADIELAQAIVDSAGVIVHKPDMTVCYDESGTKYEIPRYVLSEPRNLIQLC